MIVSSDLTWNNETRHLRDLKPQQDNPRTISESQAKRLLESWDEYNQVETLAIGPDGTIYNGHQRYYTLLALGNLDLQVDVRVSSRALTQEEWRKLTVFLHEGIVGDWDFEALKGWDTERLLEWGFEEGELEAAGFELGDAETVTAGASVFDDERIIDAAFAYFRETGFPYRSLPVHVCMQEVNKLARTEPDKLLNTGQAYHVADTYHPHRFHAIAEGMKSPVGAFDDNGLLRRALRLQLEQNGMIPPAYFGKLDIVSGTQACSNFRPGFACYLYRKYANPGDTVLDCSTGYGGRLVGFIASGIAGQYIGIDPNVPTHEGNVRMAQDLGFSDKVELYNQPAEDVPHDKLAGRCDFAFTSPPYFAKEHYSDDDTQSWVRYQTGDDWRQGFLEPFMTLQFAALKPGKFAIVNIADVKLRNKIYPLERWATETGQAVGFEHVTTDYYALTRRFGAGQADEVAREPVIVFRKPATPQPPPTGDG